MKRTLKSNWKKVDNLTDNTMDYSDSPEVTEEFFKIMTRRDPEKVVVNLRLNREVVDFFRAGGKKYQNRINDVLVSVVNQYKKTHSA
jgi:uncharacterized protein (DUF4415 family)